MTVQHHVQRSTNLPACRPAIAIGIADSGMLILRLIGNHGVAVSRWSDAECGGGRFGPLAIASAPAG